MDAGNITIQKKWDYLLFLEKSKGRTGEGDMPAWERALTSPTGHNGWSTVRTSLHYFVAWILFLHRILGYS